MTTTTVSDAYQHVSHQKANLPTPEVAGRLPAEVLSEQTAEPAEQAPPRYPRLEWNREGETQDESYGPLYVHDRMSPQQVIETLRRESTNAQLELLSHQHNGLPAEAIMEPYQHRGDWTNRLIRATGQRAMRSLLYKEGKAGTVNLVYMDPPYNISFSSQWQLEADDIDMGDTLDDVSAEPQVVQAFRDTYNRGVHGYLSGLYEQLTLARQLLAEDGSIIMQIGPDNVHEVKLLMSEVFGKDNHVATIPYITGIPRGNFVGNIGNWLLWFAKDKTQAKYRQTYSKMTTQDYVESWDHLGLINEKGERRKLTTEEKNNTRLIPKGWQVFQGRALYSQHVATNGRSDTYYHHPDGPCPSAGWSESDRESAEQSANHPDHECRPNECQTPLPDNWHDHKCTEICHSDIGNRKCPKGRKCGPNCKANALRCKSGGQWSVSLAGLHSIAEQGKLYFEGKNIMRVALASESPGREMGNPWLDAGRVGNRQYVVETPPRVLERCIMMTTDPGDLVLDLTCGSGAMPVQCENWGRRWIAVDVSAVSISIARERISITTYDNHVLRDSYQGHQEDQKRRMALLPAERRTPFKAEHKYHNDPSKGFVNERQVRVSAATLAYGPDLSEGSKDIIVHPDRTLKDNSKVRVAGPFTVESDSPYRAASPDEVISEVEQPESRPATDIQARIIDHLGKAPVQAQEGEYRLENIQPAPEYSAITHTATAVFGPDDRRNAAIYVAREDEIISAARVKNAANLLAANQSLGQHLIMVGFGQDSDAASQEKFFQRPPLDIDIVIANRDLQLQYLKDDDKARPFTVVSEPDVTVHHHPDGKISIELLGINAFNGAKRQVESKPNLRWLSMMIDPDYDGDRFRAGLMNVRPSKRKSRLLKQLKAVFGREIDDAKFAQMQTTESLPFTPGERIAVKVIDQIGMEHMTVLEGVNERR